MKPWQRSGGGRPDGPGGSLTAGEPSSGGDSRGVFDDLRQSLDAELEREPGSVLLVRASLETLLGACMVRAQQSRGAVGLVAFELDDWKTLHENSGASAFAGAFADLAADLRRRVRASDELGRLGEAQLAAILPGCEAVALGSVSERLRMALEAHELELGPRPVRLSFTVAWLAAAPRPAGATPARMLEELASLLERARAGAPG